MRAVAADPEIFSAANRKFYTFSGYADNKSEIALQVYGGAKILPARSPALQESGRRRSGSGRPRSCFSLVVPGDRKESLLILTRKIGEGLTIGDEVRVVVLELRGKQVRLGIEAPAGVVVLRDEIFQRLLQENLQAAAFVFSDLQALQQLLGRDLPAAVPLPPTPPQVPR